MTHLPLAARRLIEELRATGRKRVRLSDLRRAWHAAAPECIGAPDQRERLAQALTDLNRAGHIRTSKDKRSLDRSAEPPLPRTVHLLDGGDGGERAASPEASYPWRPELAFAAHLSLRGGQFESLKRVNDWLRDRQDPPRVVPARERSLEILEDEKALDRLAKTRLFAPGRLSFDLLACRPVSPPFVYREVGEGDVLLAVENHDTFHSLSSVLAELDTSIGFVAYGSGRAFERSVTHVPELPHVVRRILYFGDLDAMGLRIPILACRRAVQHGLPVVEPAPELYELLLEIGRPAPCNHPPEKNEAAALVRWLPAPLRPRAASLLLAGQRIAQEWVGLDALTDHRCMM